MSVLTLKQVCFGDIYRKSVHFLTIMYLQIIRNICQLSPGEPESVLLELQKFPVNISSMEASGDSLPRLYLNLVRQILHFHSNKAIFSSVLILIHAHVTFSNSSTWMNIPSF